MTKRKNKKRKIQKTNSNLSKKKVGLKDTVEKSSTISACLIVKNEEVLLPKCLESIKSFVDEIIIVDTGSTDKTLEIAESHGAKIYHHLWENDFSKHRNQSISHACCDWIFVVDGDEELIQWDQSINSILRNKNINSVYVKVENIYGSGEGESWHNSIRLFRNNKTISYQGKVHNQLMGANRSSNSSIVIYHRGYCLGAEKEEQKYLRTSTLLKKEIEKDQDNPNLHHYLSVAYLGKHLYDEALEECKQALYLAEKHGRHDVLFLWTRFVASVCYLNSNRPNEAKKICLEAIEKNPMHLDSHYLLSSLYYSQGSMELFMEHSDRYLSLIKQLNQNIARFGSMVHNSISHEWRIHLHRGFTYTSLGREEKAKKEYSLALKKCHNKNEYYKQRCLIHLQRSENRLAKQFLKKALKYYPEDKELNEAKVRLMEIRGADRVSNKMKSMMCPEKNKTNTPTISLCMIVKNEEKFLPKCLDSVKDYVDEIVIVDTGSTDGTVEIARKYTEKVYFHPWESHFSKHRNQSIKYATKDWIFILDADEALLTECGKTVRESIQDESIDSVYVVVRNAFDGGVGEAVHNSIRIFKNNGKILYKGRVHNRIVGTEASKIYPITILHEGYNLPPEESRKKFVRTTALLKKEIKENPQHPRAYHYLAASYLAEEMYEKAIDNAIKAIQLADEDNAKDHIYLWSHFIASLSYIKTNCLDEAEQISLNAIHKSQKHLDSHYLLTIIYFYKKDREKLFHHSSAYLSLLERIAKTPGEFGPMVHNTVNHRWRVHIHRAFAFQEMEKRKKAEGEYLLALKYCDDKREYYKLLTSFHIRRSEFPIAEEYLLEALKYDLNDWELYRIGAQIYCGLGMKDKEKDFLKEAIKKGVNDLEVFFRLGTIYLEEKQYNASSSLLEKVIEMDEGHLGARINLGIIAKRSGDLNGALIHLEKALEISPDSVEALSNLGYVYFDGQDFLKAKEIFEHLDHMDPTLLDVPLILSMIYIRIGSIEPVVDECDKILSLLEMDRNMTLNSILDLSYLFINIGEVLLERERPKLGILAFDVASHLNDGSDVILKQIGDICFQKGHYNDSLKYLEKVIRLTPQDWESFFMMGSCYEKMGVKEGAAISYEKARALNPDKTSLKHLST
ncbi:MAG: glycosyltransferase [Desulfobacterales bacterium]|jgi:tetratricopeptide (TPR) repeat protein